MCALIGACALIETNTVSIISAIKVSINEIEKHLFGFMSNQQVN